MENTEADVCCSSELWRKDRTSDECYYQNSTYLWTERWSLPKLNRGVGLRLSAACRSVPGALPGLLNPHWHLVNGGLRWDNDSLTPSRLIETTTLVNTSQGPEALSSCVLDDWQPTPASSLIILRYPHLCAHVSTKRPIGSAEMTTGSTADNTAQISHKYAWTPHYVAKHRLQKL